MGTSNELRALVERYAAIVDQRRFEELSTVFTADAVLTTGNGVRRGVDEIVTAMAGLHRYVETRHEVGDTTFAVTGDGATGTVACEAHHLDEHDRDRVMTITYRDRYVATDAGWRIAERTLETHADGVASA